MKSILPQPAWLSPRRSGASHALSTGPNRTSQALLRSAYVENSRSGFTRARGCLGGERLIGTCFACDASQATLLTKTTRGDASNAAQKGAARAACRVCRRKPAGDGSFRATAPATTMRIIRVLENQISLASLAVRNAANSEMKWFRQRV